MEWHLVGVSRPSYQPSPLLFGSRLVVGHTMVVPRGIYRAVLGMVKVLTASRECR